MQIAVRRFLIGVLCAVGVACSMPAVSAAATAAGEANPGVLGGALEGDPLLDEGGQQAAEDAALTNPEAIRAREESLTKFEGLDTEQAAELAAEAFPVVVTEPAGGPPALPSGQTIANYLTSTTAEVDLGGGRQAVLETMQPVATETSSGELVPVDLGLRDNEGTFEPATPVTVVRIPKHLSHGVALPGAGVSLTPVDASGTPLAGSEGVVDGATVLYANTQTDMDSLVKPTTGGFAADTVLRSVESPERLIFKVGVPAGASLVSGKGGAGAEVIEEGDVVATITPPRAHDAAGTSVPISMSLSGDTLALSLDERSGEYQFPIEVDPEVSSKDIQLVKEGSKRSNWEFYQLNGKKGASTNFASSEEGGILKTYGVHEYKESEIAFWVYQTRGVSKIYMFEGETEASNKEDRIRSTIELQYGEVLTEHGTTEAQELLSAESEGTSEYTRRAIPKALCPSGTATCPESAGHSGNAIHFQQSVANSPTSKFSFSDELYKGTVYISEPTGTHSTASYNTSAEEFEIEVENSKKEKEKQKRKNAFHGTSNWLSEFTGAVQFISKDPGIGVAKSFLEYESAGKWEAISGSEHNYLTENLCKGVQCEAEQKEYWTLNPHLPNGEDKIRYRAEEAFGQETHQTESPSTEAVGTVKVDTAKPHEAFISGLPWGNELSEKRYELTTYASDGEAPTVASSGIPGIIGTAKGIALFVDGHEATEVGTQTGCSIPEGECTASAKWTIEGAELGAGRHAIVVVVKDRAGNERRLEETLSIRHSTPVPLGPGSVDLESGDFTLGPTDVTLGSGLSVSRVYSSRDLTAGGEGPLGPQWRLSIGSEENLTEMVDGSVLVTSGTGGQTIFAAILNSENKPTGKFEAPPGDSNLTMTLEENETTKEKLAYYLKDPAAGTSTKFTLSSAAKVWVPVLQEGPVATDTVTYLYETVEVSGKKITRPSEIRAATPAHVSCSPKMEPGCRALKFVYATTTTATGENESEWGEFKGRLSKVVYEGYNPATKKMLETPIAVAEYRYDKLRGRLRSEWDPRISPALKTDYGYNLESQLTALDPPGEESWTFTYGTKAGDSGIGRIMKAAQAPTTAGLFKGEGAPTSESGNKPVLTGTAVVGTLLKVSTGGWKNSPLTYEYHWREYNPETGIYTLILGANSPNYVPTTANIGHEIVAEVSATNGGGTFNATWVSSPIVKAATEYPLPTTNKPTAQGIVEAPDGNMWFGSIGTTEVAAINKLTPTGTLTETALPKESRPKRLIVGPDKNLWFGEGSGNNNGRMAKITTAGVLTEYAMTNKAYTPSQLVNGPDGNIWSVLTRVTGNSAIAKTTTAGVTTVYELGSAAVPGNLTVGPEKTLWFTIGRSTGVPGKIDKITTSGVVTPYALPNENSEATDLVLGPDGNVWFTEDEPGGATHVSKVGDITLAGVITEHSLPEVGTRATKPGNIVVGPDNNLWFTYQEGGSPTVASSIDRITTTTGKIAEYVLPPASAPTGLIVAGEAMWFTTISEYYAKGTLDRINTSGVVEPYSFSIGTIESENAEEGAPHELTTGPNGSIWFGNTTAVTKPGELPKTVYSVGKINTVAEGTPVGPQPGFTVAYGVPLEGSAAPAQMGINPTTHKPEPEKWGQKEANDPAEATSIFPPDSPQNWPAANYTRATTFYLDEHGRVVNTEAPSTGKYGSISTTEYNEYNDVVRTLSPDNRAKALEAGEATSAEVASLLSTFDTYRNKCSSESEFAEERESIEPGTRLCETEGPAHAVKYVAGKEQLEAPYARDHAVYFYDQKIPVEGPNKELFSKVTFNLVTKALNVVKIVNAKGEKLQEVEPRTTVTSYEGQNNLGWTLREPTSVTSDPEGAAIKHETYYNENGQVTETRGPLGSESKSAHNGKIIYYGQEPNTEYKACGKHAEWAGLVCETLPGKQPETAGVASLPVTTTTYNIWNEPETIQETFPKSATFAEKTRTTKDEYDAGGRLKTSEETSTATTETNDKALPKVTEEYSATLGVLEKQKTTVGETTKTVSTKYSTLGLPESYTDADGNVSTFKYAGPAGDELLEEMRDGSRKGESYQKYTYSTTTKQLEKLVDSSAGTFTATYDTEGHTANVVYPSGMCANYGNNSVGELTHVEYIKTSNCAEKEPIVWFSETLVPSARGEAMSRASTLASETYEYDTLGRMTGAQETPVGEFCKMRLYAYDKEANRTKLTTREPNAKKECATEGGVVQEHTFDEGNRLTDTGITYDPLGNTTKLPASDGEGHPLESTFYVDNAIATQTQNGVTNSYALDPYGRVRETVTGARKLISHYAAAGETVAWTGEGTGETEKWTRNIPGIDGTLAATQEGEGKTGGIAVLQLHDLQGDTVATIKDKTGETALASKYNSLEFGLPNGTEPPKFAWLGAGGIEKSLSTGVITYGATSYVPQTGRALQSEAVAPPGLPDGSGGAAAEFTASPWNMQGAERVGAEAPGLEAAREREVEEEACRANPDACAEDPAWSGDVSIAAAEAISGALEGMEIVNGLGAGKLAEKIVVLLADHLHVNFLTKLKEVIQKGLFGYSLDDVEKWAFSTGGLLQTCSEKAAKGIDNPKNPHCWLYITTTVRHAYKKGPGMEVPDFAKIPLVGYCPWGTYSACFIQNIM